MRRILVTATSGDVGNSILKILVDKTEDILFGCDINEYIPGIDYLEEFWQCKYAVQEGYIEELLERCVQHNITHLIPVNEREIEIINKHRNEFRKHNIKLVMQSEQVLDICLDKQKTSDFLCRNGIVVPKTFTVDNELISDEKKYIVKEKKSNGSKGISIYEKKDFIKLHFDEDKIIQEYIDSADEYTIGVISDGQNINVIIFKRELKNGYSHLVKLVENDYIKDIAMKIAKVFNLCGYFNIQGRLKDEQFYVFEINPRLSGTSRFQDMLGFESVLWWLNIVDGEQLPRFIAKYREAVGIRELNEKYIIKR